MTPAPLTLLSAALSLAAISALALAVQGPPSKLAHLATPTYKVHVFPVLAGQTSAYPKAMNADGMIVGHFGSDPFDPLALPAAVSVNRTVLLKKPTDSLNFALGIGGPGLIVGTSGNQPVAWQGVTPNFLVASLPGYGPGGAANDANIKGAICGNLFNDFTGQQVAVYWPSAGVNGIALPLGTAAQGGAFAINDRGVIAGLVQGGTLPNFQAARWDHPGQPPAVLGVLPGAMNSEVVSINAFGDTAGRSSFPDFSTEAILHVRATNTLIGLGQLSGTYSYAYGVNGSRQVVGTSSAPGGTVHAFLWQEGVLYDLNDLVQSTSEPILYLSSAVAIDEGGHIAAEALVATPSGPITKMALVTP